MFSWICSKCGRTVWNCKTCKCGNNTEVITIDGKSFEVIVNKYAYQKEPQRNEDFRVPKEDE